MYRSEPTREISAALATVSHLRLRPGLSETGKTTLSLQQVDQVERALIFAQAIARERDRVIESRKSGEAEAFRSAYSLLDRTMSEGQGKVSGGGCGEGIEDDG